MDKVMRAIKQKNLDMVSQKMDMDCELTISVRSSETEQVFQLFDEMQGVDVSIM
jgi:putative IMPACT (imprinted ancient) family translation regulator